jgi:hypothetical protein
MANWWEDVCDPLVVWSPDRLINLSSLRKCVVLFCFVLLNRTWDRSCLPFIGGGLVDSAHVYLRVCPSFATIAPFLIFPFQRLGVL